MMKILVFWILIVSYSFSEELISTAVAQKIIENIEKKDKTENIVLHNVQLKNKTRSKDSINIKTNRGIKIIGQNINVVNTSIQNIVTSESVTDLSSNSGVEIEKK